MIPAPLLNRQTAVAVVVVTVLVVGAALVATLAPIPEVWFSALAQVVAAAHAVVLALAVFLAARTLAPHSLPVLAASFSAVGGFVLLALLQLVGILLPQPWTGIVQVVLLAGLAVAAVLLVLGLVGVGVAVLRRGAWRGPTRVTLVVAGVLVVVLAGLVAAGIPLAIPYAVWALVLLGLVAGLRSRREVPDVGVPDTQLGAAKV